MLFSTLWAYHMTVKNATGFTLFHVVHGIKATLPIECEIPTLHIAIELFPDIAPVDHLSLTLESRDEDLSVGENEMALWAHHPYIGLFSQLPHSSTGAQSLRLSNRSRP